MCFQASYINQHTQRKFSKRNTVESWLLTAPAIEQLGLEISAKID